MRKVVDGAGSMLRTALVNGMPNTNMASEFIMSLANSTYHACFSHSSRPLIIIQRSYTQMNYIYRLNKFERTSFAHRLSVFV